MFNVNELVRPPTGFKSFLSTIYRHPPSGRLVKRYFHEDKYGGKVRLSDAEERRRIITHEVRTDGSLAPALQAFMAQLLFDGQQDDVVVMNELPTESNMLQMVSSDTDRITHYVAAADRILGWQFGDQLQRPIHVSDTGLSDHCETLLNGELEIAVGQHSDILQAGQTVDTRNDVVDRIIRVGLSVIEQNRHDLDGFNNLTGEIVEGHSDLRPPNIFILPDPDGVQIIDPAPNKDWIILPRLTDARFFYWDTLLGRRPQGARVFWQRYLEGYLKGINNGRSLSDESNNKALQALITFSDVYWLMVEKKLALGQQLRVLDGTDKFSTEEEAQQVLREADLKEEVVVRLLNSLASRMKVRKML